MHYRHKDMVVTCNVRATYNLDDVDRLNFNVTKACWGDVTWMEAMVNDHARPFNYIRDNRFITLTEAGTPQHPFRYVIREIGTDNIIGDLVMYQQDYVLNILP